MQKWSPGSHGGTYGGNAIAAGGRGGDHPGDPRREDCSATACQRGVQLMTGLRHLQEEYPAIGDVRGLGLDDRG